MSAYENIKAALFAPIVTAEADPDGLPGVAWPNKRFKPVEGDPYCKVTMMYGEPHQAELGSDGMNYLLGVLQVDCFWPADGQGDGDADALAQKVVALFKRGTVFTSNGQAVTCDRAWPGPAFDEGDWYHVPVSVAWHAYATN